MIRFLLSVLLFCSAAAHSGAHLSGKRTHDGPQFLRLQNEWFVAFSRFSFLRRTDSFFEKLRWIRTGEQTCGVTSGNEVACWQVGATTTKLRTLGTVPGPVVAYEDFCLQLESGPWMCRKDHADASSYAKVDLSGLDGAVRTVRGTATHACALTDRGRIYCWGQNYAGKLGLGGLPFLVRPQDDGDWSVTSASPGLPFPTKPVQTPPEVHFLGVSVHGHTSCAWSNEATNNAYCWGRVGSAEGLETDLAKFSQVTQSAPKRIGLENVAGHRLLGLTAGPVEGFGWDAENAVYWWGAYDEQSVNDQLALQAHRLASLPKEAKIEELVPARGEVCALTKMQEAFALFCSQRADGGKPARFERITLP